MNAKPLMPEGLVGLQSILRNCTFLHFFAFRYTFLHYFALFCILDFRFFWKLHFFAFWNLHFFAFFCNPIVLQYFHLSRANQHYNAWAAPCNRRDHVPWAWRYHGPGKLVMDHCLVQVHVDVGALTSDKLAQGEGNEEEKALLDV